MFSYKDTKNVLSSTLYLPHLSNYFSRPKLNKYIITKRNKWKKRLTQSSIKSTRMSVTCVSIQMKENAYYLVAALYIPWIWLFTMAGMLIPRNNIKNYIMIYLQAKHLVSFQIIPILSKSTTTWWFFVKLFVVDTCSKLQIRKPSCHKSTEKQAARKPRVCWLFFKWLKTIAFHEISLRCTSTLH